VAAVRVAGLLPRRAELRPMLRLAVPVVTVQVGMMAMGVVDTIMVGHISAQALAAVALGNLYFFSLAVFAMGTLMVLDPVVAQAVGAGDRPAIARAVQRGVLMAGLLTLPAALLLTLASRPRSFLLQPPTRSGRCQERFPCCCSSSSVRASRRCGERCPSSQPLLRPTWLTRRSTGCSSSGTWGSRLWVWWARLGRHRSAVPCS
jgi:MatE